MSNWTEQNYDPSLHNWHKGVIDGEANEGYPQNYYYADSIRGVIIGFGNYFNDLYVIRYNENGEPIKKIQVPVKYGPRTKSYDMRVEQESGKKYYIPLPNITFRTDSYSYAQDRNAGTGEVRGFYSNYFEKNGIDYVLTNKFWKDIQPVPYNITITMEAKTEHMSDANQIIEQILSRFAPESFFDLKEFWFVNKRRSIKMKCESCNVEMTNDFGEEDKREITVSFSFTIEAFFYKKIQESYVIDKIVTLLNAANNEEYMKSEIIGNYQEYDTSGNYNRRELLSNRYNFSDYFGTKIDYEYKLLPIEEQPVPKFINGDIIQEFKYKQTNEIKNYPENSKLLIKMETKADENKSIWNSFNWLEEYKNSKFVNYYESDIWQQNYWSVTADSLNKENLNVSGKYIYQIYHNPSYIINDSEVDNMGNILVSAKYGGTIIKTFQNLYGFGKSDVNINYGLKDANLSNNYIIDAPYVTSSYIETN